MRQLRLLRNTTKGKFFTGTRGGRKLIRHNETTKRLRTFHYTKDFTRTGGQRTFIWRNETSHNDMNTTGDKDVVRGDGMSHIEQRHGAQCFDQHKQLIVLYRKV